MVGYAALVLLLAKLARALELWERTPGSSSLLVTWPLMLGDDLVLLAAVGLLAILLRRVTPPWARLGLLGALLLPLAVLLPADVVSHRVTGTPLTWQRLRGDEGGHLGDIGLLANVELWGGLAAVCVLLLSIWPAFVWLPRLAWLRRWAGARALLVTLLSGVGLQLLQGTLLPQDHGLARQPLFVLAGSVLEQQELGAQALNAEQWHALQQPSLPYPVQPAPPVTGAKVRNVVIFLAEGIAYEHTGFDHRSRGKRPDPTPNLTRRRNRDGFLFDRYYANWHASIQAIFSVVCSAFPPISGDIVRVKPRIDCGELSEQMRDNGVAAGLFHGGQFNFYNKLGLLGQRGYQIELDAEELAKTSRRSTHQWGIDDRAVVEATLAWVDGLPQGQRFAALLIPITAHYPYWTPGDFKGPFPEDARRDRFLNAVAFQDQVFEQLLRGLEQRGLYEDTLFVWLGDHGNYVGEPARRTPGLRMFYEPNLRTALTLISPRLFPRHLRPNERVSHRIGQHADLLPTVLDAMGLPLDQRHQGQSLLAREFEQRRVFFAADNGEYLGFIEGERKFVFDLRRKRTEYYDLGVDPDELKNLSSRFGGRMTVHAAEVLRFARAVRAQIEAAPELTEDLSVEQLTELYAEHVQVRQIVDGKSIACPRDALGPLCPDGRPLRVYHGKVDGEQRRCVMVKVPAEGDIELELEHRPLFPLLTGTMVVLGQVPKYNKAVFYVRTRVDGKRYQTVQLVKYMAARPRHPRAQESLAYSLSRAPRDEGDVRELCLQLTTLAK